MIKRVQWTSIWFHDVTGQKREIKGLSLPKRRRFLELLSLLSEIALEESDQPIAALYDQNQDFQLACNECLGLFAVSPDWISASMLVQLLFSCDGGEGLLLQLEFPSSSKSVEGEGDPYFAAIATVWSHMPDKSLNEVREVVEAWTWAELSGVLQERNEQTLAANPELKKQAEKRQKQQELREEMLREVKEGSFQFRPIQGALAQVMQVS